MPADLDQSGRNRSHRTIVRGERLVQLRHDAPDRGLAIGEINLDTGGCQIECSLHPTDPGADDQCGTNFFSICFKRLHAEKPPWRPIGVAGASLFVVVKR